MAKKVKIRTDNYKPAAAVNKEKTISAGQISISGIIKNVYNEVGHSSYSTLGGTDANGIPLRAITHAEADPLMMRYEYPTAYDTNGFDTSNDELDYADNITAKTYYFEHDTKVIDKGKKIIRRYEKKGKPYISYDEEYFQHIFNWPTSHTLRSRKLGGFVQEDVNCTTTTSSTDQNGNTTSSSTSSATSVIHPITATFNGTMTLEKVESQVFYINDDWSYTELPLNDDGSVNGDSVSDRIGNPVIYHGGTEHDGIFFNYVVDLVDQNEVATDNLIAIGDTVNGATITNVINYIVDVALKRTASRHPKKGEVSVDITEAQFLALDSSYTSADYANTQAWIKLNRADGIAKGNVITGKGIASETVVTGVDESRNRIYISKTLTAKKVKVVRFFDSTLNKVNKSTLCYAKVSGGNDFAADTNYSVTRSGQSTGITICTRAGKGIINRSAIVGTYFSKGKKELEYQPVFYSADPFCEKESLEDSNGKYILGTVIWDDNSRLESKFLMVNPSTQISYTILSIYIAFTNAPIDKETLESFLDYYKQTNDMIKLYKKVNDYVKTNLGNKRAAGVFDDICRDELSLEYSLAYNPFMEVSEFTEKVSQITQAVKDDCLIEPSTLAPSIDDAKKKFEEIINNSVQSSSFLSKDYYERLVSNEDSLFNKITNASKLVESSTPKNTKVSNLPPPIEGEDSSGVRWVSENFRSLPPAMDRVKFFINDISLSSDVDLDPSLNLDPATTTNQPKIIIRTKPCWRWSGTSGTNTFTTPVSGYTPFTAAINVNVNNDSNGYLNTITTSTGAINLASQTVSSTVGGSVTICIITRSWVAPSPKSSNDNITFGEKSESFSDGGYIVATNWSLPPNLRDLDNIERSSDSDISSPTVSIYPKTVWAPNINYQMDYHKMFFFRTEEMSELIGETIENYGNPYIDDPIRAKLTKTIGSGDTTIRVQSTEGFLSSGYLIIPKYTKKLYVSETGNLNLYFTYCGEEIIYYGAKTATTFTNCQRELFGTTSTFEITVPSYSLEQGVRYKITSLGNSDWKSAGAGNNPQVGTVFTATSAVSGTGSVEIFGSNGEETPDESSVQGIEKPANIPVITSYEYGFSVSQHWVFKIRED